MPEQELLITASADQTLKIWNFSDKNISMNSGSYQPFKILYDHEEEIVSAHVSAHGSTYLLASIDREGCVIVRDLRQPDFPICNFKPEKEEFDQLDTASISLNNFHMINTAARDREDLFITINNQLYVYCLAD